jgi:hypothetical protein
LWWQQSPSFFYWLGADDLLTTWPLIVIAPIVEAWRK